MGRRTIAPIPLAQAAAFDPELVRSLAHLAATEARSGGVTWTFSPMADVSRDPRWGRVSEGFGEDPWLTSHLVTAMVRGYQGDDFSARDAIAATAKHFVGYGAGEGGRDYNGADLSERALRTVHLPPFEAAVRAGAASVMAAFTSVSGIPMHAHRRLLTDVLKREWGFGGVVVGDAEASSISCRTGWRVMSRMPCVSRTPPASTSRWAALPSLSRPTTSHPAASIPIASTTPCVACSG